ncbi:MAG: DUF1302 domain-containing protein [Gammaproteobacteria bacterium]|nr:DUF1302 domain-containing protein [Gammaproteobacteria bacterium]
MTKKNLFFTVRTVLRACAAMLLAALAFPAQAIEFQRGEMNGSFDTTLSAGVTWRVADRDEDIVGLANGGNAYSVNADDGNLNYDTGIVSQALKATSELELNYRRFAFFTRASYFYDFENEDGERERTPLTEPAKDLVGSDLKLLDAYVHGTFEPGGKPLDLRLGNQVVSWGESTFIQNSINTINPVDVSKLRVPGAELREALEPVPMLWGSLDIQDNVSFEAFYQFRWEKTKIDPPGSYFSTNDYAGEGGNGVVLGFGKASDQTPLGFGARVPRTQTREADDNGQYGFAVRWLAPTLADTEFGFYFINYHSRLPLISVTTGTVAGAAAGDYAGSARYFTEYPEDIKLYGLSVNADLGNTGISVQGEISYRQDVPLQVDDVELLYAALSPPAALGSASSALMGANNQIGDFSGRFNTYVPGFRRTDVSQIQATLTKMFGPALGANQWVLMGEIGVTHADLPDKDRLRFEGAGTFTGANPIFTAAGIQPATMSKDNFPDELSWGYRMIMRFSYENVFQSVNLYPKLAFAHDVSGTSPGPGGNFIEDRKAVTLGLEAVYLQTWSANLGYTRYFGAEAANLIHDRDFISLNLKYAF